ncbi:hypothetical protein JYK14_06895 [Siccirubricoccus sp. KC 17139]|uniref:Uncharacterized protein n=1 Tax=Siccirubricoccus soli TaxID=2899147 RepID=A0ABT1D1X2_9PROT|nr:hypothetical protein [Siccirubricoccus soli]MCO6415903.1 hypothetical protein [Siccirubricoccus soli]MCP2682035.1 hypothetical protein [Siccirubricoccus soli]
MGDIVQFPNRPEQQGAQVAEAAPRAADKGDRKEKQERRKEEQKRARAAEAALLRKIIAEGKVTFASGESERVAAHLNDIIDRCAKELGRGGVDVICRRIWPNADNPARRRGDLKVIKAPKKLLEYAKKIAQATGSSADDVLLEAFRDTRFGHLVYAQLRGEAAGPELEAFWVILSDTLHALADAVVCAEGLEAHMERLVALHGRYDLAADAISPSSGRLLGQPLANWNEHADEFPPIPSVVLFTEPKSATVERNLTVRDTGEMMPVRMTVLREARLAIGPADSLMAPVALFEFRSVMQLVGPTGPLRIRRPWLYLDESEVEVELDGVWRIADIPFDGGNPDDMPEGFLAEPHVAEVVGPRLATWRFPAALEAPLQFEHNYVVWRPVTAGTCRELLLRPRWEVALGPFAPEPPGERPDIFCPPGTLAEAIEVALHVDESEGLKGQLHAAANRMVTKVRAWQAELAATAEAAHRELRAKWGDCS